MACKWCCVSVRVSWIFLDVFLGLLLIVGFMLSFVFVMFFDIDFGVIVVLRCLI